MSGIRDFFYTAQIKFNQRHFLKMQRRVLHAPDLISRCVLAQDAAYYAINHTTDIFSSEVIEAPFLEFAQQYHVPLSKAYKKNSVLHVLTEAYVTGGHTRCAERWIDSMKKFHHSCVILNQHAQMPENLAKITAESGGKLIIYDTNKSIVSRALDLRNLASKYQYVVLYTHMHDSIPLIAFGTPEFQRPIIYFNHADHLFWLGISISDCVAELNDSGMHLSISKRGSSRSKLLGIPPKQFYSSQPDKNAARQQIGVSSDKKVIFSSGSQHKYAPIQYPCFYDIISDLVESDPNIVFYIATPNSNKYFWRKLLKKYPNNVFITGELNNSTNYPLYLAAADLVMDSTPIGGGTALSDAFTAGKPVITLNKSSLAWRTAAGCKSYSEFLSRTRKLLYDNQFAKKYYDTIQKIFIKESGIDNWCARCQNIIDNLPAEHQIYYFHSPKPSEQISDFSKHNRRWIQPFDFHKFMHSLFSVHIHYDRIKIKIFGKTLIDTDETLSKKSKNFIK